MIDKLKEMLEMQAKLDEAIFAEHGTSYEEILKNHGFFYAILDELGEWNHERKPMWCWWKKGMAMVNGAKELEEFVDVFHFVMSHDLAYFKTPKAVIMELVEPSEPMPLFYEDVEPLNPSKGVMALYNLLEGEYYPLIYVFLRIAKGSGYTFEDIYNKYMAKNKINFERLANGY